ncbi:MAG: hypothetical protein JW995_08480 [Melioribacteraceae bacterium]|nr:hypothetical protein [Melioribacteraceae bacterium]
MKRDGTSQNKRLLKALDPAYIKVDERNISDLLLFVSKYAEKVQYYNSKNKPDGNWKDFIENDVSAIVSIIALKDLSDLKSCVKADLIKIKKSKLLYKSTKTALNNLFRHIFFVCEELNSWYIKSISGLKLNSELKQIITSQLSDSLKSVITAYKYAKAEKYLADDKANKCKENLYVGDILNSSFNSVWIPRSSVSGLSWSAYLQSIPDDDFTLFGSSGTNINMVKSAAEKLETIIDKFIGAQARLIKRSPDYLKQTLESYTSHQPQMALLLAFLQLFKYAQDDLNKMTKRHLDFYYQKVLRLNLNDATPDTVHVIFDLAKHVDSYLIKKGTQLKAGKDSKGVEVVYEVDEDTVFNTASVQKLKSVFIDKSDNYRIYCAPVANSSDGNGGDLDEEEPKWKTFGESQKQDSVFKVTEERTMLFASIGIAITSPVLFLSQGLRTVTITFTCSSGLSSLSGRETQVKDAFAFYLSGEEKWIAATTKSVTADTSAATLSFVIELSQDCEETVAFNSEKLTDGFVSDYPVMKIILKNPTDTDYIYSDLKDITISKINLQTDVKYLKDIILQNDSGLMKTNKPFYPFSTVPGVGSNFYIGSKEIFQKDVTKIALNIEWKDVPASKLEEYYYYLMKIKDNESFKVDVDVLIDNEWENVAESQAIFVKDHAEKNKSINLSFESSQTKKIKYYADIIEDELTEYNTSLQRGFLRLALKEPADSFGHHIYRDTYTKAIILYANKPSDTKLQKAIPNEPYTPLINNISVDYTARDEINVTSSSSYKTDESKFYHIYPFGIKEVRTAAPAYVNLLPSFKFTNDIYKYESEGELYIGIKDLDPPQNISILFQMAEGSADPEADEQKIYWSYLSNNEWLEFEDTEIISDTTDGLLKSGIIKFSVPSDATNDDTLVTSGYHWIRACVDNNTEAVCDSIEIIAQAVKAKFKDNSNDPNFLANVLPADTISKMVVKDGSVKKIKQPYASLGGKVKETSGEFYTRVSERLRHKDRGVTIWDYEKLILQEFPLIYKVKCINHSTYYGGDSEFAPGCVSLIVIPKLFNKNSVNPLEPRATSGELKEIKKFLEKKISLFAAENIMVMNPLYEKIIVEFQVEFIKGCDWGYYKSKLHDEIIEYLSPWAYKEGEDIAFGGRINKSLILNFVEERNYVDYVAEFKMLQITDDDGTRTSKYTEEAECSTARSILVSNDEHVIKQVTTCK